MSKRKSGLTKEERNTYLRENGWEFARDGKGSHNMLVHPEMKELAQKYKIEMPINIRVGEFQPAWSMPFCDNPASGTWARIEKQVEWCTEKIGEIKSSENNKLIHRSIKAEFNNAVKAVRDWKHETKHRLKAALSPNPAPESYHLMPVIAQRKRDMKGGL